MRSVRAKTSFIRCETKSTATPSERRRRVIPKRASTSSSVSELVGSSRISTRASIERARAISTICCWSGRSRLTGVVGLSSSPSRSSTPAARRFELRQLIPSGVRVSRWPRKMFSAIVKSGTSVVSWVTVTIPLWRAAVVLRKWASPPSSVIRPASGRSWPERMLISVDFPEPFSPIRPWISPRYSSRWAPRRARTPPKRFRTSEADRIGLVPRTSSVVDKACIGSSRAVRGVRAGPPARTARHGVATSSPPAP